MKFANQSFGKWVKSQRKERGWTQTELGEKIGYAEVTVRKLEANEYPPPVRLIEILFEIFQVPIENQPILKSLAQLIKRRVTSQLQISETPQVILPVSSLNFIGRDDEFQRAKELLSQPDCHLLSLIGLGGVGKTQLALQIGHQLQPLFKDGVHLISFVSLNSSEYMISLWSDTFGIRLNGYETVENQVLEYLSHKNLLIILDSFENVLSSSTFLTRVLKRAPEVKLLVTSRERLNLSQEWSLPLFGLKYPDVKSPNITDFPAVKLFIDTARRIRSEFQANELNIEAIINICRTLGGLPLGIEMTASWIGVFSCHELADLVQHQVHLLEHRHYDVPDRHKTMRTIFEASWQQLTPDQQAVLQACSLFKGGFTQEAAIFVSDTTPAILASLQDKFLLIKDTNRRYQIHDMLYQFISSTLSDNDQYVYGVKHCSYFAAYVSCLNPRLQKYMTVESVKTMTNEIENIRQAWLWLCSHQYVEFFDLIWEPLFTYYNQTNDFEEGESMFARAAKAFSEVELKSESTESLILAMSVQAFLAWRLGDVAKAVQQMTELNSLLVFHKELYNKPLVSFYVYETEGFLAVAQGDVQRALILADYILASANEMKVNWYLLQAHLLIGRIHVLSRNFEAATNHLDEAIRINTIILNSWGMPYMLTEKGYVLEATGDLNGAFDIFGESLTNYQMVNDTWGIIMSHVNLGRVTRLRGYLQESADHHLEAIQMLGNSRQTWLMADNLTEVAMLFHERKEIQRSLEILDFVLHHPACTPPSRHRAQSYRQKIITNHSETPMPLPNHMTLKIDIKEFNTMIADQLVGL